MYPTQCVSGIFAQVKTQTIQGYEFVFDEYDSKPKKFWGDYDSATFLSIGKNKLTVRELKEIAKTLANGKSGNLHLNFLTVENLKKKGRSLREFSGIYSVFSGELQ